MSLSVSSAQLLASHWSSYQCIEFLATEAICLIVLKSEMHNNSNDVPAD